MVERETLIAMVRGVQKGEGFATAQLYETFKDDFYYFILKTVNNDRYLAEDLTQDTFVQILEKIHELQEPASFVTWGKQIAYHKCTDYFKKKKELLLDENEDGSSVMDILEEEDTDFIPDAALEREDLKKTILAMINDLPEEQKSAILLRYYNEISVKDIAQIQGASEGTVKSRLNYARKTIKQAIEAYEKKSGIKLHCVGVIPVLLWLFKEYRMVNLLSPSVGTAAQTIVLTEGGAAVAGTAATAATTAAATTAAATGTAATAATATTAAATGTAATAATNTVAAAVATKVIAGVVATVVTVGSVGVGIGVAQKHAQPEKPAPEAAVIEYAEETGTAAEEFAETRAAEAGEEETVAEETTAPTTETVDPETCQHSWDGGYYAFSSDQMVYTCTVCQTTKTSYGCDHNNWSKEYWTDPESGTVWTFHTCTDCSDMYSSTGTPGQPDYISGNGAPDAYAKYLLQQQQQATTEATEEPTVSGECEEHDYSIEETWEDPSDGTVYTFHTCSICGYTYSSSAAGDGNGAPDGYYAEQNQETEP